MDSNKIKNLATGAREALRAEVNARLDAVLAPDSAERLDNPNSVHLIEAAINERGRDHVVDQAAYTWFNRLCALRYMDARGYTPVPAVTPREGSTQPAILADATQGVFDPEYQMSRLTRDRVSSLLLGTTPSGNATEAAYAQLIGAVCTHYAETMPYLFKEEVASSLLMPQGLLSEGSILQRIVEDMNDENCASVEVLGWLYQYYIAEKKDEIFASNKKRGADEIGPATQLFTPNWIVRYMAENSLGRIWMLNNPHSGLRDAMEYYIEGEMPEEYLKVYSASELKVLDPACGSGHILVYCFDLLFAMYEEEGWQPEDIPAMILQNNLYGFEIDGRAGEIAKFALEMKAREKDPMFFDRHIDAMVTVLEPVRFTEDELNEAGLLAGNAQLLEAFDHLDEIGSLYVPELSDEMFINNAIENLKRSSGMFAEKTVEKLNKMKEQVQKLSQKFSAVVANPPYIPPSTFEPWARKWVQDNYPDEKADTCVCFIERGFNFAEKLSLTSMITMQSWMFLSSYERMRERLIKEKTIVSMVHLGARAFDAIDGEVVSTTAITIANYHDTAQGVYVRLVDLKGEEPKRQALIEAIKNPDYGWLYRADAQDFKAIPGNPIAYWISCNLLAAFKNGMRFGQVAKPKTGLVTGDNNIFMRLWWEVGNDSIGWLLPSLDAASSSAYKWFPCQKGGSFRKWYGNNEYLVDWQNNGYRLKNYGVKSTSIRNTQYYFKAGLAWTEVSSGLFGMRYVPEGYIPNVSGPMCYSAENCSLLMGYMNSSTVMAALEILAPTLHFSEGPLSAVPIIELPAAYKRTVVERTESNIKAARTDWDAFETSWDFKRHPLSPAQQGSASLISDCFARWSDDCQQRFDTLKANEEELNRIFAEIYHMEGEVPIEVPDDKVSVRRADLQRDIKSLISYGVGCLLGRYSVDQPGLILADQGSTAEDFREKVPCATFDVDEDGILPVLDGEWFADDVTAQFKKWLETVYGPDALSDNVAFIEDALGKDIRSYFVKDFYADHVKTYQKRPIYWLFSSPKKSFSALIYLHRYTPSTVGQILTGYLREYIEKLNSAITALDMSDRAADRRQADKYRVVVKELSEWERDVVYPLANEHIEIDLDDGVKVNYNKFPHALRKVTGLSEWK